VTVGVPSLLCYTLTQSIEERVCDGDGYPNQRADIVKSGILTVQVDQTIEIAVSTDEARRMVSVFVLTEIGNLLHGETPILVVGKRIVWCVPVHLTRPSFGDLGQVGHIDVDVKSGELVFTPETISLIERNADELAVCFTSPLTKPRVAGLQRSHLDQ